MSYYKQMSNIVAKHQQLEQNKFHDYIKLAKHGQK